MAFWRKKDEGFEWREYVRTTILLRRQERRQKIEDVKAAAFSGVKSGGRKGFQAAARGVGAAGGGLLSGALRVLHGLWRALRWGLLAMASAIRWAFTGTRTKLRDWAPVVGAALADRAEVVREGIAPYTGALRKPELVFPIGLIGAIAALATAYRILEFRFDGETLFALSVALIAALLTLGPKWADGESIIQMRPLIAPLESLGRRVVLLPVFERLSLASAGALALFLMIVAGTAAWQLVPAQWPSLPSLSAVTFLPPESREISGRARALDGSTLRVDGQRVQLEGIEAPDPNQVCLKEGGKRWKCGSGARSALARALGRRRVICSVTGGADKDKPAMGSCRIAEKDIAAELVRGGHVFAESGLFSTYANEEREAEEKKAGLWAGKVERPEEWRARRWEEAKSAAPDGCPIKGEVSSGRRVYLLPWSPRYDRARINKRRGERWFCSEEEAEAAGWKPKQRS